MPEWTPESEANRVFDRYVFDPEVFDASFAEVFGSPTSGTWITQSAETSSWTPEDGVS